MSDSRTPDPIIDEVRRNREALLRAAGGSIEGLFEKLKESEKSSDTPPVRLPARRKRHGDTDTDAA